MEGMGKQGHQQRKIKRKVIKIFPKFILGHFRFIERKTGFYTDKDLLQTFVEASFEGTSVEDIWLKHMDREEKCPSGDDALYHIKRQSVQEVIQSFERANDDLLRTARRQGVLKPGYLAFDRSLKENYGKANVYVVRGKQKNGTSYFYSISTVDTVGSKPRFTLKFFINNAFTGSKDVPFLVSSSEEYGTLYFFDRGFCSKETFEFMSKYPYVTPARMNKKMRKTIDAELKQREQVFEYSIKGFEVTTFFYENPRWDVREASKKDYKVERYLAFHTSLPYIKENGKYSFIAPSGKKTSLEELGEEYRQRWGIETDYRTMKNEFLALTTSTSPVVHIFLLCLSILLRNVVEYILCTLELRLTIKRLKRILLEAFSDPDHYPGAWAPARSKPVAQAISGYGRENYKGSSSLYFFRRNL